MKLVLDTVVLIRALVGPMEPQGRLVLDPALDFEWIAFPDIVSEYQDVLSRPQLRRRFRQLADRGMVRLTERLARATIIVPTTVPRVCRDPHDDMFLSAALAGGADTIVSEDRDLLSLEVYEGITIRTAQEMITMLTGRVQRESNA